MKKFLIAAAAVALLSGPALAQNDTSRDQLNRERMGVQPDTGAQADTGMKSDKAMKSDKGMKAATAPMKKKHRSTTGQATDKQGYTKHPPVRDPGRYSNLPGKDGYTSKAHIQDH